jgi:hypothetical protein
MWHPLWIKRLCRSTKLAGKLPPERHGGRSLQRGLVRHELASLSRLVAIAAEPGGGRMD